MSQGTRILLLILAVSLLFGAARAGAESSEVSATSQSACRQKYNGMVSMAKQSLFKGDRGAAIKLLIDAQAQLGRCEELEHENSPTETAIALN